MDIIASNVRNSSIRRQAHLEGNLLLYLVSNNLNSKITFYTVIKILFLIAFSIFQILMLTSIFGKVKVTSKIVVSDSINNSYTTDEGDNKIIL
jgi:hypothetical protein